MGRLVVKRLCVYFNQRNLARLLVRLNRFESPWDVYQRLTCDLDRWYQAYSRTLSFCMAVYVCGSEPASTTVHAVAAAESSCLPQHTD